MAKGLNVSGDSPTIVPNLNASNRALPRPISASIFNRVPQLDAELQVKFPGDKQLLKVSIVKKDLTINDGEVVSLVVTGAEHKLYDKLGHLIAPVAQSGTQPNYAFTLDKVPAVNLFLEVVRPAATPVGSGSLFVTLTLFVTHPGFVPVVIGGGRDSADRKDVWISLLRFVDNTRPVERLFICDLPDNEPTVKEVQAELRAMGMGHVLDKIPFEVCKGDAWLQDQYQEGYCIDDRGNKLRMVWHLPRLRSETSEIDRPNLSTFVDCYFPSTDTGLIKDFWQRKFEVVDARKTTPIAFRDTFLVAQAFRLVDRFYETSISFLRAIGSEGQGGAPPTDAWEQIRNVHLFLVMLRTHYQKAKKSPMLDNRLAMLTDMEWAIAKCFPAVFNEQAHIRIRRKDGSTVVDGRIDVAEIRRLHDEYAVLHDSVNYGGNIEVAPPASDAKAPRAVIGNSRNRPMDKAVVQFLLSQAGDDENAVPVEIDTSWLKVGHVDELISFVSAPGVNRGWAILQNSPAVALDILLEAVRYRFQDTTLDLDKTDWGTINGASLDLGNESEDRYISRVLRGKYWEYVIDRKESAIPQMMPPQIYLASQQNLFTGAPDIKAQVYPASQSILEILRLERQLRMNRDAQTRLDDLFNQLRKELDSPDIAMLPAIFDVPEGNMTETFLPNPVNLQVVGNHVLMPRPFGPRMKADDAVAVMKRVFHPLMHSLVTTSFIRKMKLETQTLNIKNYSEFENHQEISSIIFKDHYPDTTPDFEERLVQANQKEFTSGEHKYLKDGWRKLTIPEKTVDLFEFYMTVVLTQIGITVHWIDTWYYHIRHGGLHCGTNCIRKL